MYIIALSNGVKMQPSFLFLINILRNVNEKARKVSFLYVEL